MTVVHLVRNFSAVGGMERFVISLVAAQLQNGYQVVVLCNQSDITLQADNLSIIQFDRKPARPRWREAILFGNCCLRWLNQNTHSQGRIVHSHERTWFHDLATFHGQTYRADRKKNLLTSLSIRHQINYWLEARQINCSSGQGVVPVSMHIDRQLRQRYQNNNANILPPINPGAASEPSVNSNLSKHNGTPVIGFIGKEWKRKGLVFAFSVIENYCSRFGNIKLHVIGPDQIAVQKHIPASIASNVTVNGWRKDTADLFLDIDLLMHPASSEPYGMVIVEAMSHRIPVVVSDASGASSNIGCGQGRVLSLSDSPEFWAENIESMLRAGYQGETYSRPWSVVADDYDTIYQQLSVRKQDMRKAEVFPKELLRGLLCPNT